MSEPLVLSMSAISTYLQCRKKYQLSYVKLIDGGSTGKMAMGTAIHACLEAHAKNSHESWPCEGCQVAGPYLDHKPLPYDIVGAEKRYFTELLPNVYLRTTMDLVYYGHGNLNGWVVGRDYKTFDKAPTIDYVTENLDFQRTIYVAVLRRQLQTKQVIFEHEFIRQVPPGTKNSKGTWKTSECYVHTENMFGDVELETAWNQAVAVAKEISEIEDESKFYRLSNTFQCKMCYHKQICSTEMRQGYLDEQDIEFLSAGRREKEVM